MAKLGDVCSKATSNIAQKDLDGRHGEYPIYGASGLIKAVDFYQQESPYIAVVKDGAGVGRVMKLPAKSSVIAMPGFRKQIESMQAGTTVSYLSIAMIKRLQVMIPSMEVQNGFNDFVRRADKSKLTIQQSLIKQRTRIMNYQVVEQRPMTRTVFPIQR